MSSQIQGLFMTMRLWDVLDILVVAFFLYRIYILIRDTRATALLKGLIFLGLFTVLAGWLQLHVVSWILDKLMTVLIVALPVVFQPELRRLLGPGGKGGGEGPGGHGLLREPFDQFHGCRGHGGALRRHRRRGGGGVRRVGKGRGPVVSQCR